MMMRPILLFLDVHGVINVLDDRMSLDALVRSRAPGYAVKGAKEFLQAVDRAYWIKPVWISSIGEEARQWNDWAKTRRWDVAYPLAELEEQQAQQQFPKNYGKCRAARWYSRDWQHQIVWIEDNLARDAERWAEADKRVCLIDTYPPRQAQSLGWREGIRRWNMGVIRSVLGIPEVIKVS